MRVVTLSVTRLALVCLTLVGSVFSPPPARGADEPNASWAAGSRWNGIVKQKNTRGQESSFDGDLFVNDRDGGKFAGTWTVLNGNGEMEIAGKINGTRVDFTIMKIVKWNDPNPRNPPVPENLVGLEVTGRIRKQAKTKETSVEVSYKWPSATDPTIVRNGKGTLVLQE